jgi:hypothetical protein
LGACALAPVGVIVMWVLQYRGFHSVPLDSIVIGLAFAWVVPSILYPLFMSPSMLFSGEPKNQAILPWELLRLSRTPVGWALLREGAEQRERRKEIRSLAKTILVISAMPGVTGAAFSNPELISEVEANIRAAWTMLLRDESDLVDRQRRHLAGETVDYKPEWASAP